MKFYEEKTMLVIHLEAGPESKLKLHQNCGKAHICKLMLVGSTLQVSKLLINVL